MVLILTIERQRKGDTYHRLEIIFRIRREWYTLTMHVHEGRLVMTTKKGLLPPHFRSLSQSARLLSRQYCNVFLPQIFKRSSHHASNAWFQFDSVVQRQRRKTTRTACSDDSNPEAMAGVLCGSGDAPCSANRAGSRPGISSG